MLLSAGPLDLWFPEISSGWRLVGATVGVVVFFASILAHEAAHAWAARRHDVTVSGITLWLFGGLTEFSSRVPNAKAEFQIAAVGPLTNGLIGFAFAVAAYGVDDIDPKPFDGFIAAILAGLAIVNLAVAAFNLIPAPPLDGGRLLAAGLWRRVGDGDTAKILAGRTGLVFWGGLVFVGVVMVARELGRFDGWWSIGLGAFFLAVSREEILRAALNRRLRATHTGGLMSRHPRSVNDSLTVSDLLTVLGSHSAEVAYPVTRWDTEPVGYVVPAVASLVEPTAQSWTKVQDIMVPATHAPRAWSDESLDDLLNRLEPGAQLVVIHDVETGEVAGTLSAAQIRPHLKQPDFWGRG